MKLHDILYGIGFICMILGIAGLDGWMCNGTSLVLPLFLLLLAGIILYRAMKEDGRIRKKEKWFCRFGRWQNHK